MRIGGQPLFSVRQPDQLQQFQHPGTRFGLRQPLVQNQGFGDLLLHRVQRVERRHRLLEDHRNPVAADAAQGGLVGTHNLVTLEPDRAAGMARHRIGQQLQHRQRRHRLAGTRFADQRHGLAFADIERDVPNGINVAARCRKADRKIVYGEKLVRRHCVHPTAAPCAGRTRRAPPRRRRPAGSA